jgi:hypothetical protein
MLSESLADWTDADVAAYALAVELGVMAPATPFAECKWIFWSANRLGDGLHTALLSLVAAGVLESRDDEAFRWNFDPRSIRP